MATTIVKDVLGLIELKNWKSVKVNLSRLSVPDLCQILFQVSEHERGLIFRYLSREKSSSVFSYLELEEQNLLLKSLTNQETRHLLASMPPDDRTQLLSELPSAVTLRLFELLSTDDREESRMLLGYPEESIGRIMTPDFVKVRETWSVAQSLEHIRFYGQNSETINIVYIVNETGKLLGSTRLRTLILMEPTDIVEDHTEYESDISLSALADQEEAVNAMRKYDVMALPVVDSENDLIGIVTFDDIMDVAEEEATEDMQKSASVNPLKEGYHRASVRALYAKRVGWLVILVVLSILSSSVIKNFTGRLNPLLITSLIAFVPLLLGAGGNAGSQASTLVIRALVTNDIQYNDILKTVLKEIGVGLLLGMTLGFIAAIIAYFQSSNILGIASTVGLSMLSIVMTANLIGMSLPFILSKIKIDPAVASAPLIATLTDVSGLVIYFSIAMVIIGLEI